MQIHGFQKMTLLDFPGKVACTVFTGGCNFRCPFCHNALLVTQIDSGGVIAENEVLDLLKKRIGLLDGVAITGGEPLLQPDLPDFIRRIKEMGYAVKLDTNGSFPDRLRELFAENLLDYVAMDIKNSKEKYAQPAGLETMDLAPVEESVRLLAASGIAYEFRTTVVAEYHTVADFGAIGEWIAGAPRYFLQGFTDSGNLIGDAAGLHAVPKEEMEKMRAAAARFVPNTVLRGI